jgi:hypothetical protein
VIGEAKADSIGRRNTSILEVLHGKII